MAGRDRRAPPYLFNLGIWWIGLKTNRSGCFVQALQMNS
jgi:hypothetical protein